MSRAVVGVMRPNVRPRHVGEVQAVQYLRFVQLPSRLIEAAVDQMATLPGIGRRTALRLVLHMLARDEDRVRDFAEAMVAMREGVRPCSSCHNPTEGETCNLCANPHRDRATVCVVEDVRDLLALESIGEYRGLYHVLGGVISPMDGIGPSELRIESLLARAQEDEVEEVIFALPTTMEGDTTAFYINKRLVSSNVHVTTLARGVAVGDELQYADELTLIRSLQQRLPYANQQGTNGSFS